MKRLVEEWQGQEFRSRTRKGTGTLLFGRTAQSAKKEHITHL